MTTADLLLWSTQNPALAISGVIILSVALFFFVRATIARGLIYIAARTASKVDDMVVRNLHPFRVTWLAPLLVIYASSFLFPDYQVLIQKATLFLIIWLIGLTLISLLNAVNEIYESSKNYNGVSIQGYLDIVKILFVVAAIILSITVITGESPWVLITGLGALTAVLLLIFQNTILSLVASIQIVANDLLKEGDWIEVPSFEADGDVVNISLHTIKIRRRPFRS